MKAYLCLAVAALLSSPFQSKPLDYDLQDYNEDVLRVINLEIYSSIEVTTEIKFKTASTSTDSYYYVVPRDLEHNHMSI